MPEFEWDPRKADANFEKHGVDFMEAIGLFEAPYFTYPSRHEGESRFVSVGLVGNRFVSIVWTFRGSDVRRIISARSARREERDWYRQSLVGGP